MPTKCRRSETFAYFNKLCIRFLVMMIVEINLKIYEAVFDLPRGSRWALNGHLGGAWMVLNPKAVWPAKLSVSLKFFG